jgi:hypothetical protein
LSAISKVQNYELTPDHFNWSAHNLLARHGLVSDVVIFIESGVARAFERRTANRAVLRRTSEFGGGVLFKLKHFNFI